MQGSAISQMEITLLILLTLVAAIATIAKRLQVAYPIVLVIGGLCLGLLPRIPRITLNPEVVFLVFLPPLLFSAGFQTSWREFKSNLVSIVMLAFGLVTFTVIGVAATTRYLLPGFDWKLGLVLGSVVAATDAIAATATAKRLGLPRRITELLEAESLVNDGSGLVALRFTLAMLVTGVTPSIAYGAANLLYLIVAAVVIGLVVAAIVRRVQARINDAPVEITISLITPYVAYLAAEAANCSGVLATLACGIYLGRRSMYSLRARIEATAVWNTLDFLLNGLVFLVLGLQLPVILTDIRGMSTATLLFDGALFSIIVIVLRMIWVFPGARISAIIRQRLLHQPREEISRRSIFLVGWAGMRGVLALAAALSLPEKLANGAPFPQRNLIIFLTFCVIFSTLVIQGLSLPTFIRRFGLANAPLESEEEKEARHAMAEAALRSLEQMRTSADGDDVEFYNELEKYYSTRLASVPDSTHPDGQKRQPREQRRRIAQQLRNTERAELLKLRDENRIHDEVLRTLERELDFLDARFAESEY